jgi:hypothetical protein
LETEFYFYNLNYKQLKKEKMKKLLFSAILATTTAFNINAQNVIIPDANFKTCLLSPFFNIDTNADGEIQASEAIAYTGQIDCNSANISDVTGLEAFINITGLDLHTNNLTAIDVSQNTAITYFNCDGNQLLSIDISNNTALTSINCQNNQLASLDVSNNTVLTQLYCYDNQLTQLSVKNGNNNNMVGFQAHNNPDITCIEVDNATYSTANWTAGLFQFDIGVTFSENCATTAIADLYTINNTITVYPNPTNNIVNI